MLNANINLQHRLFFVVLLCYAKAYASIIIDLDSCSGVYWQHLLLPRSLYIAHGRKLLSNASYFPDY